MPQVRAVSPSPDVKVPPWVSGCDDSQLRRTAGPGGFARGTQYARSGAVLSLSVNPDGALLGTVRGSGRHRYAAVVRPVPARAGRPAGWSGTCSCPVQVDCKHSVAVLLTARRHVPAPPAPPHWERRLAKLVEAEAPGGTAMGLQVEVVEPARTGPARRRLRLRPLRQGASGKWVRTGASWRDLQYGYAPTVAAHREALLVLQSAWQSRRPAWYPLSDTAVHVSSSASRRAAPG